MNAERNIYWGVWAIYAIGWAIGSFIIDWSNTVGWIWAAVFFGWIIGWAVADTLAYRRGVRVGVREVISQLEREEQLARQEHAGEITWL